MQESRGVEEKEITRLEPVLVACSGGIDSALFARVARGRDSKPDTTPRIAGWCSTESREKQEGGSKSLHQALPRDRAEHPPILDDRDSADAAGDHRLDQVDSQSLGGDRDQRG